MNDALSLQGLPQGHGDAGRILAHDELGAVHAHQFLGGVEGRLGAARGVLDHHPEGLSEDVSFRVDLLQRELDASALVLADGRARSGQRQHRAEDDLIGLGERGSRG
jgi:hypothetical protein